MKDVKPVPKKLRIRLHPPGDREAIYRLRYRIYASELHQHLPNREQRLTDKLDAFNYYIGAHLGEELIGFVSITPPGHDSYSVDKYLSRDAIPFAFHDGLYEIRILAVEASHRESPTAVLLMYGAYRLIEHLGGTHVMAMGRVEVLDLYLKLGMATVGCRIRSGEVNFELMHSEVTRFARMAKGKLRPLLTSLATRCLWELNIPYA